MRGKMKRHIGEIIFNLRREKHYTQRQISDQLCSVAEIERIEAGKKTPNYFLLDMLFERMGKATDRLEYILPRAAYRVYELRFQIQREILYQRFETAEQLIDSYEKMDLSYQALHTQFIEQERAQIAWLRGEGTENVLTHLNKAIVQTMDQELTDQNRQLSADEIKLLLFRWEVCKETERERSDLELARLIQYLEGKEFEVEELAKVYPYTVLLCEKTKLFTERERKEAAKKALEILGEGGQILFLAEILGMLARYSEEEEQEEYAAFRKSVLEVEEEYGVHYENMPLFHYYNRVFELDYDVIKRTRSAQKLSQEMLSEDICTQETLSRIENGKNTPNDRTLNKLMKKMNRERQRIEMNIVTERYEVMQIERELAKLEYRKKYEECENILKQVEHSLDMSYIENQQYIQLKQISIDIDRKKQEYQESIEKLYDILYITLPKHAGGLYEYPLTDKEILILNMIAIYYCQNGKKQQGIHIWEHILKNFELKEIDKNFYFRKWELIAVNCADRMEEFGNETCSEKICKEYMKAALEIGRGGNIGRTLEILACGFEALHTRVSKEYFRRALGWNKLMKQEYRYFYLKKYLKEMGYY